MMKSLVAAAAIAAGMMTFAASAQERAENPKVLAQSAGKKTTKNQTRKAPAEADACPYLFGCGSAKKAAEKAGEPNVDKMQTASIAPRVSPKLNAKARKKVIRKAAKAEDLRKDVKAEDIKAEDIKAEDIRKDVKAEDIRKDVKAEDIKAEDIKAEDIRKDVKAEDIRRDIKAEEMPAATASTSGVQYGSIVARYAASYDVPASLAHAVIRVESNYRVNALGSAGEIGLMQIKPATARMMGYSGSAKGLYNPETNIKFGIKYLSMAHKLGGGTTCGTILKYNAGHAAKRMNPVSARYCSKVKQHLAGA
jgi:soluble lytic murein transglycosylase-like protein